MVHPFTSSRCGFAVVLCCLTCTLMAFDQYSHRPEFDGKICRANNSVFIESVPSKMKCTFLCRQKESCVGFFYKHENKACIGCSESALEIGQSLNDGPGATYFQECETIDDLEWTAFQSSKYKIFSAQKTYDEGRAECRRFCSDLIHLNSVEESIFFDSLVRSTTGIAQIYIGLTDREIEGQFKWSDDGTPLVVESWAKTEPGGGYPENCVSITSFTDWKWVDLSCDGLRSFVCEK